MESARVVSLHVTYLLVVFFIPTKYESNRPKNKGNIQLRKKVNQKVNLGHPDVRGDKYITNKVRVVSLACDTPTGPPLYPYQI